MFWLHDTNRKQPKQIEFWFFSVRTENRLEAPYLRSAEFINGPSTVHGERYVSEWIEYPGSVLLNSADNLYIHKSAKVLMSRVQEV